MTDASLRGDCDRCIGLCCVALAFDRGPHFAFDKAAGETCRHLTATHHCTIHDDLVGQGLGGCAQYDCYGAGQVVTAMFAGLDVSQPSVGRQMFAAFAKLRELQLLRVVVQDHRDLRALLDPPEGWTLDRLLLLDLAAVRRQVQRILAPQAVTDSGAEVPPRSRVARQSGGPS